MCVACVSCQDSTGLEAERLKGIQFVEGANVTDTAAAFLSQSLVVEIHDTTGALAPTGTVVNFTAVVGPNFFSETLVQSQTVGVYQTFSSATTNAAGRVGVNVRLGVRAGAARLAVAVPALGLLDTARFTIVPAAASRVTIDLADTALYVGANFTTRGAVQDQFGNARSDAITWTQSGPGIAVSSAGVVSASAIGRHQYIATAGTRKDTASVSVVPAGRIAAWSGTSVVSLNLDGSDFKTLAAVTDGGIGVHPTWMPGTADIVYTHYNGTIQELRRVTQTGTVSAFFASRPGTMSHQADPTPAVNGQHLYFAAWDTQCAAEAYCLYRSKFDASEPEVLGNSITMSAETKSPAPSPDGSKVAFTSGTTIRVLDVASKTVSSWSTQGSRPAWSPDGSTIAFVGLNLDIRLIDTNGTNERTLTGTGPEFSVRQLSWSADNKYILARDQASRLQLIDAATGGMLPLPYSAAMFSASLK